jgi:hypothetical protein
VSAIKELLGRNNSGSGLESQEYGRRDPLRLTRYTTYPQKLILTSPTSGGRSVGIVRSRTKATEFNILVVWVILNENCVPYSLFRRRLRNVFYFTCRWVCFEVSIGRGTLEEKQISKDILLVGLYVT